MTICDVERIGIAPLPKAEGGDGFRGRRHLLQTAAWFILGSSLGGN